MNLTLILRDVPLKGDSAYNALYALCPKRILYTVDFGIRTAVLDRSKVDQHRKQLEYKLLALREVAPFNGASEVCPVIPSHWLQASMKEDIRGYAAGEAFRLFTGVKRVYLDLGVSPNIEAANEMAETLRKLDGEVSVVCIVPLSSMLILEADDKTSLAPFVGSDVSLEAALKSAHEHGAKEVFLGGLGKKDAADFEKITCESPIESLVFWSAAAARDLELKPQEKCVETPAVVEKEPTKKMRALHTSIIWEKPRIGAELVGHVAVDDVLSVHVLKPNPDGTAFGKIVLKGGGSGYIVVKHFNQEKFMEV